MNMLTYVLESIIAGAVIYSFIKLTMRREGQFGYVRFLWLLGMFLTALLPLADLHLDFMEGTKAEEIRTLMLPEATVTQNGAADAAGSPLNIFLLIYLIGAAVSMLLCIFWGVLLWSKISECKNASDEQAAMLESLKNKLGISCKTRLLISGEDVAPCSWMNIIVVSKKDMGDGFRNVLIHELAHVRKHHSADLLLSEIFIVTQWFNPFIYLMRKFLVLAHDYSADQAVLDNGADESEYRQLLIKKSVGACYYHIANGLNKSNLKNRFIMMTNPKHFSAVWKSLFGLPIIALLAVLFSSAPASAVNSVKTDSDSVQDNKQKKPETQVRDTTAIPFTLVDAKPLFQGKEASTYSVWIQEHLQYPAEAKANKIQGMVAIQFTINEEGNLVNPKVLRSPNELLAKEALRVVEESASIKWTPGYQKGKPVPITYTFPVKFNLPKTDK